MKPSGWHRQDQRPSVQGFTLIEMLVVLAVLLLVSGLLLPVALRGRSLARESRCKHSLKELGVAITQDYLNEVLPETVRLTSYWPLPPARPMACPPAFAQPLPNDKRFTSDGWHIAFCDPTLPEAGRSSEPL